MGDADHRHTRVLLISLGELNQLLLKLLARSPGIGEIVVATRDIERAVPTVNLARMGSGAEGLYPKLRLIPFDLNQGEASAATLRALEPDVTFAAPSLQSWWVLNQFPADRVAPLRAARFGAWLPFQLLPMIRLMRAWKLSGLGSPILSAPYPDVVNPILATHGLAPTCGVGNVGELVPKLQWLLAERLSVAPEEVRVWLAAHHAMERYVYASSVADDDPPPYLLKIQVEGKELDTDIDIRSMLLGLYPLPDGLDFHFLTVGAAIRAITAFLKAPGETTSLHVPGPAGLPGGYPALVGDGAVRLDLPSGWTQKEAVEVNRASHRWDGIESIEPDGTVVLTERTAEILRETMGYDGRRMAFDEVEAAAHELRRRFDAYVGAPGAD